MVATFGAHRGSQSGTGRGGGSLGDVARVSAAGRDAPEGRCRRENSCWRVRWPDGDRNNGRSKCLLRWRAAGHAAGGEWTARRRGNAGADSPARSIHLSGLAGLIDATRRAHAVIGVDSGPMHLAAALSKPGVAIFGPTDPARNGPYGGSLRVLRSPAAVTTYKRRADDRRMRAITPAAVLEALAVVGCPA